MPPHFIPAPGLHRQEQSVKRSRFIVSIERAENVALAKEFITRIKQEFPDATHNCWAFNAGPAGDSAHVGCSDDGEPHNTAGKPMLSALSHSDVGEIAVVVTRYYGGVKLGTGGLVKAYSGMVILGLEHLPVEEKIDAVRCEIRIPYSDVTLFKRLLPKFRAEILDEEYGVDAQYRIQLPRENAESLMLQSTELTNGKALISFEE